MYILHDTLDPYIHMHRRPARPRRPRTTGPSGTQPAGSTLEPSSTQVSHKKKKVKAKGCEMQCKMRGDEMVHISSTETAVYAQIGT